MSWQARLQARAIRLVVRRRSWGDEQALARRARLLFGAPAMYSSLAARGVRRLRVHEPVPGEWLVPGAPLPGTILYLHGGGFVACSAATHRPIAAALARWSGRRVFSADYRLAPEHRYPTAHQDVLAAYRWLLGQRGPGDGIVVAGDSAGGNLVLSLAQRLRDLDAPAPVALILFSPWLDLTGGGASVRDSDGRDPMFHADNVRAFAEAYLGGPADRVPAASPLSGDLAGLPPALLHVGATEILLDDARRAHRRIIASGGSSRLRLFEDVAHGWQMLVPFLPEAVDSLREAAAFAREHLGAGAPRPAA